MGRLDEVGLAQKLSRDEEERELKTEGHRLAQLRLTLGGLLGGEEGRLGPPLVTVFEGWDASGKGGAIKRLVSPLDPRHVRVAQFAAPSAARSATTSSGGSGRSCRAGEAWRSSIAPGTGACWSSGSRASPRRRNGAAPTTRSTRSSDPSPTRG